MYNKDDIIRFGSNILKLQSGLELEKSEVKRMMELVIYNEVPEIQQGAFLATLYAKPATSIEEAAVIEALKVTMKPVAEKVPPSTCKVVGQGSDSLKTFNVTTVSSIVASACGANVLKSGVPAITGVSGTLDFALYSGLKLCDSMNDVISQLKNHGFAFIDSKSAVEPSHYDYYHRLSNAYFGTFEVFYVPQMGEDRIALGASNTQSPEFFVNTMKHLGISRAISFHGKSYEFPDRGFDEVSNIGPTLFSELKDGHIFSYIVEPHDLGISTSCYSEITARESKKENLEVGVDILKGKGSNAQNELVAVNASVLLYITDVVSTVKEGVKLSLQSIQNGIVTEKYLKLINQD